MITFDSPMLGGVATVIDKLVQAKAALWLGKILSALGLGFAAQTLLYDPLIDQAVQYWQALPASFAAWVHAIGLDTGVSIILSAYGVRGMERVFLARRDAAI